MSLRRGSAELLPIYQNCIFRSDTRVDSHWHVAQEIADHQLRWKRGVVDAAMYKGMLRRLEMLVLRYGAEVEVTPALFQDFVLVHMSLRGAAEIEADGIRLDVAEGRAAVVAPTRSLKLRLHEGAERLLLKIPKTLVQEVCGRDDTRSLRVASGCMIPRAIGPQWNALIHSVLNVLRMPATSGLSSMWLDDLERNVVLFLLAHQPEFDPSALMAASRQDGGESAGCEVLSHDSRRVDAMMAYMKSRLSAPVSLQDLALAAGVSVRTLNSLCHRHLGETPMELLRNMRLDAVHNRLRLNPSASVTDTALEFGFGHLGRFAAYYAERFSELPRQTGGHQRAKPRLS